MGFLHASTSIHRFAAPVPAAFDRPHVAETVTRHGFRAETGDEAPEHSGWVAIHDPLVTELTPADLFFQHYLAVGFRHDRRTVPAQLLRLERRRLERERARERGLPRLGAAARREIKLEVEARLTAQALPAPRIVDCVWNLERGRLYVSGGSRALHGSRRRRPSRPRGCQWRGAAWPTRRSRRVLVTGPHPRFRHGAWYRGGRLGGGATEPVTGSGSDGCRLLRRHSTHTRAISLSLDD